jgi:hypothetical protein
MRGAAELCRASRRLDLFFAMRKLILGLALLVVALGLFRFLKSRPQAPLEEASVAERRVVVWSRQAQVREPVANLQYGDRVFVLEQRSPAGERPEQVRIRTLNGVEGWVEARQLMDSDVARRAAELRTRARTMPVQARSMTKVPTNVRLEPGRSSPRILQLNRGVSLEVLARSVLEFNPPASDKARQAASHEPSEPQSPRREAWLLVRGTTPEAGELAGWVRGSFLEPDLPEPLPSYAQGIRFVAWFELNRVPDAAPSDAPRGPEEAAAPERGKPQYLAAGLTGGEGGACDFTLIRFYTWNSTRRRYETAFVESNLCGKFPIRVVPVPPGADPEKSEAQFSFAVEGRESVTREYRMKQNIIRPVRAGKSGTRR